MNPLRDLPEVLIVVIHGKEELGVIVQNMMLRPFQGFLFKPLNIRFDQRHRLGDILIQGGHGNLLPTLLPKGVG